MKILTISIPAYNVEKYIQGFLGHLDSIKEKEKLEVLIVNDGSTDSTGDIVDEFVRNSPGVFRHIKKENGGHGSAITEGIKKATGKYFYNIDGDDDIHQDSLDELLRILSQVDEDAILLNYDRMDDQTGKLTLKKNTIDCRYVNKSCTFSEIYTTATLRMHTMVLKTAILQQNNIVIDEHRFYVDKEYIFYSLPLLTSFRYVDLTVYKYRIGLQTQSMSIMGARKHNPDREFVSYQLAKYYENNCGKFDPEMEAYLRKNIAYSYVATINGYLVFKATDKTVKKTLQQYDKEMKRISSRIYNQVFSENTTRIRKIKILRALRFNFWQVFSFLGRLRRNIIEA